MSATFIAGHCDTASRLGCSASVALDGALFEDQDLDAKLSICVVLEYQTMFARLGRIAVLA